MGYIKFLGTAGARFVMIKQLRASGGLWLSYKDTNILIDPGPGSLIKALKSRPKLDPLKLDAVLLTHKHIDHSNDVNVMIEAMTQGGYSKRGVLLAPGDCFGKDGVVFDYVTGFLERVEYLKKGNFKIKDISIDCPLLMAHSVETYGLKIRFGRLTVGLITDTGFFEGLKKTYRGSDLLIINVVLYQKKDNVEHLCLDQAKEIIAYAKPEKAILTHFGMNLLRKNIRKIEEDINKELDIPVICAYDGMSVNLDN